MKNSSIDQLNPRNFILIKGAKVHNLKEVSVAIPRKQFTVITGLSGSGKSSLAMDTLYAEGQRRYVESLSSYARQFLGRLDKPEVEYIRGISPAVAIEQKVVGRSARSTVGTSTEIYDYLKLLFAKVGKTLSPISGNAVKKESSEDVLEYIKGITEKRKILILFPLHKHSDRSTEQQIEILIKQGFSRAFVDNKLISLEDLLNSDINSLDSIEIVIDRLKSGSIDDETSSRIIDSAELSFFEGQGDCYVRIENEEGSFDSKAFSNRFELDGMQFEEPSVNFFSFNNPLGACKSCEGYGSVIGIDPSLVIPNPELSVYEDAIACWKGEKMSKWKDDLIRSSHHFSFPVHTPIKDLSDEEYALLWKGNQHFKGLDFFFSYLEEKSYKIQFRVMMSRYRGKTPCPECEGSKLRKETQYVKVGGRHISELLQMPLDDTLEFFTQLKLSDNDYSIAKRLLEELNSRLHYLNNVGLSYLNLNRDSSTLSGGESQRINLATSLGSALVGSMYILDEPSIGLHPKDTERLISVIQDLKTLGNTVIVVEHDEDIMRSSDYIIDMGPEAGINGGEVVYAGAYNDLINGEGLTSDYLNQREKIEIPVSRRKGKYWINIEGANKHNLKDVSAKVPLHALTAVTGISGSGKSTLIRDILYQDLKRILDFPEKHIQGKFVSGDHNLLSTIEFVDQNPIGKSSRSNPVTYIKAYDEIRSLMSSQALSKARAYKPATFSFNVAGGRCDHCEGEGAINVEMQFMADIKLPCEFCKGQRFKDEVLEVKFREKNIADILNMSVDEAMDFFSKAESTAEKRLLEKLRPLQQVGLGYVGLGQAANTLSGGEAQRVKLASFLSKGDKAGHSFFIFDEPTTGLHFHDIKKLLHSFDLLIQQGHSILVIEHDLDMVKNADWVIDLGPEAGRDGGELIFQGSPEELSAVKESYTGRFLKRKLN